MTIREMQADLLAHLYDATLAAVEKVETPKEAMDILCEAANAFAFALPRMEKDG